MAVASQVYGNTLSELQSAINADKAIDYQRANFQDELNLKRAVARLEAQGKQADAQSRQKAQESQNALALAQILAQQKESQANREAAGRNAQLSADTQRGIGEMNSSTQKAIAETDARARLDAAKIQAEQRAFDPRALQTIAEIEAANAEKQQNLKQAHIMSAVRKRWAGVRGAELAKGGMLRGGSPDKNVLAEADAAIKALDAQAREIDPGIVPSTDGGYAIPEFVPISIPAMLGRPGAAAPAAGLPAIQATPPPPAAAPNAALPADAADFQDTINRLFGPAPAPAGGFNVAPYSAPARQVFSVDPQTGRIVPR